MITHAEAIVAPDDGGAAGATTGGDAGPTFSGFLIFGTSARGEPVLGCGSRGEGADRGEGAEGAEERVLREA